MPEPIHTIIVERRNERRRVADFLIIWATKIEISPGFEQQFRLFSVSLTIKRGRLGAKGRGKEKRRPNKRRACAVELQFCPSGLHVSIKCHTFEAPI
jgi:hypothetical protein